MREKQQRTITLGFAILIAASAMVCSLAASGAEKNDIKDKTLLVWAAPGNLTQSGGAALSIEKPGGVFDAIVLGELAPAKWMAGSNNHSRTEKGQDGYRAETADKNALVQIAIVYKGKQITIYRDGDKYASYKAMNSEKYSDDSIVLMGLRHVDAAVDNRFFTGSIDDARLYDLALSAEQIASLKPNEPSSPEPRAWWDFEKGKAVDRMGTFAASTLLGDAGIADGRLHLDKKGAYMMAQKSAPETGKVANSQNNIDRSARALREKLLVDPHRPGYHFVVPEGRCMPFDPNGAVFWKGRYHLFYIFQDERGHNWGHVSSTDLFHWRHHPTGLVSGMFSGNCFINKDGRPTMCFHDQVKRSNAMAVALDDDLNEWERLESNLITPKTVEGDPHHGKYRSWDPFGWIEDDTYYAIFGGNKPAIAKSDSLGGEWKYVGDLLTNTVDGVSIEEDISCADFFKIGDTRMLLCISHQLGCRYYLGEWKNEQFHPTFHEKMSWADNSFFAPESLLDDQGRRIMWAWIFDGPGFKTRTDYGWSGTMSLPRVLSIGEDGALRMNPPKEIERLRFNEKKIKYLKIMANSAMTLKDIAGNSIELAIEMRADEATQFGVKVCLSPNGEEQTLIYYDAAKKKLVVDASQSSVKEESKSVEAGPFELNENEPLKLRVFVDKSVVEVFANGRQAVMRRVYPSREDSVGVALFSNGGSAKVTTVQAWDMMPSNPY